MICSKQNQGEVLNTAPAKSISNSFSDGFVRLLVQAVVIPAKSDTGSATEQDEISDKIESHRFVLPVEKACLVQDLSQKIESRLGNKLQAPIQCQGLYISAQAHAGLRAEVEFASVAKLNEWFAKQYLVEGEQSVSTCFRDFDKITCRLAVGAQKIGQNGQLTPLITQSPAKTDLKNAKATNKRKEKQEYKVNAAEAKTAPSTPTKLPKNARKKLKRRQEEEEKAIQARKMSELRAILRQSINGYSQEEAASRCISSSQQEADAVSNQRGAPDNLTAEHRQSFSDIERVLRANSQSIGKSSSSGSQCSCTSSNS